MSAPMPVGRILPDLTQPSAPAFIGARGGKTAPRKSPGIDDAEMRRLFAEGLDDAALAAHFGYSVQSVRAHRWAMKLQRKRGRGASIGASYPAGRNSRHVGDSLSGKVARMPAYDHPALSEARTIYPATVTHVGSVARALIGGYNSWKIGAVITKGRWKGFPVYTLTLEERATCPTACGHWRSCFGNQMHMAQRLVHGPQLEARLVREIGFLAARHRAGFAVRLHVLGDFYDEAYVETWRDLIEHHPALHVFGFTARIDPRDPITNAVARLVRDHGDRFVLRFSNARWSEDAPLPATVTIEHPLQKPADAILCPQQTGRTANCGTCALCWSTDRRIAFMRH